MERGRRRNGKNRKGKECVKKYQATRRRHELLEGWNIRQKGRRNIEEWERERKYGKKNERIGKQTVPEEYKEGVIVESLEKSNAGIKSEKKCTYHIIFSSTKCIILY